MRKPSTLRIERIAIWGEENTKIVDMWERMNRVPHATYVRFQRFIARRHAGKWWRGITIIGSFKTFIVQPNFE